MIIKEHKEGDGKYEKGVPFVNPEILIKEGFILSQWHNIRVNSSVQHIFSHCAPGLLVTVLFPHQVRSLHGDFIFAGAGQHFLPPFPEN